MMRGVVREELKQQRQAAAQEQSSQGHDTIKDMVNCENCFPKVVEEIAKFNHQCSDCELPLPDSLIGNPKPCPRCGSQNYEPIEREE